MEIVITSNGAGYKDCSFGLHVDSGPRISVNQTIDNQDERATLIDIASGVARLIAAAPELLEAAKNLLADVEYAFEKYADKMPNGAIGQRQIRAIKAAIAKAEGK